MNETKINKWEEKVNVNRPVITFRVEDISASIWKNEHIREDGVKFYVHNVTFEKVFTDKKTNKIMNTNQYGKKDMIKLSMLIDKISTWLYIDKGADAE